MCRLGVNRFDRPPQPRPPFLPRSGTNPPAELSGSIIARYQSARRSGANEIQTTTTDPNDEASWTRYGIFHGNKAVLTGLTPGVLLWVRVRTIGLKGVMGAWSDPAQIRVL